MDPVLCWQYMFYVDVLINDLWPNDIDSTDHHKKEVYERSKLKTSAKLKPKT